MRQRTVPHPIADEHTAEYFLYCASGTRLTLSAPILAFVESAREARVRPVLLSEGTATLSPPLLDALRFAGGLWACRAPDGRVFDALSGSRIRSFRELWEEHSTERERMPGFDEPGPAVPALLFEAYVRHRAEPRTLLGGTAEHMLAGLSGDPAAGPDRWGREEPACAAWDLQRVTAAVRTQMPRSERLLAAGPRGRTASLAAARTSRGLLEHTRGLVPLETSERAEGRELAARPCVSETLTGLAERFRPTIAIVSRGEFDPAGPDGRIGRRPRRHPLDEPLAVLLGATAVRDLRLDLDGLSARYDLVRLGRKRTPAALIRFTGRDELWHQLLAFAHDLDVERLAAALGPQRPRGGER